MAQPGPAGLTCKNCGHTVYSHDKTGECHDTLLQDWSAVAWPPAFPLLCNCKKFEIKKETQ